MEDRPREFGGRKRMIQPFRAEQVRVKLIEQFSLCFLHREKAQIYQRLH